MSHTLVDRIIQVIQQWPDWSPAERRHLGAVTEEILTYLRTGEGNRFTQDWCARVLPTKGITL